MNILKTQRTPNHYLSVIEGRIEVIAAGIPDDQGDQQATGTKLEQAMAGLARLNDALAYARHSTPREVPALERQIAEQRERIAAVKREAHTIERTLDDKHQQLAALHWQRRVSLAFGQPLPELTPLANPLETDATLRALVAQEAEQETARRRVVSHIGDLDRRIEGTAEMLRKVRAQMRRGAATKGDVQAQEADLARLQDERQGHEDELRDVLEALRQIAAERQAREAELLRGVGPARRAEYEQAMQEFADALRKAAMTAQAAWRSYEALVSGGGGTGSEPMPWPELRIAHDSRVMFWLLDAIEKGVIK